MFGLTDLTATREALNHLARVVTFTRQALAARIKANTRPDLLLSDSSKSGQFSGTLVHLEEVREGFILSQRTTTHLSLTEMRMLVKDILLDWQWVQEMNLLLAPHLRIEYLGQQLVNFNHALVALAVVPKLPAQAVTFPQPRPTYGDVPVPALPGELLERIEEIERVIYQANVGQIKISAYESLRRTYAYFEASSWLVDNHLSHLLEQ